MSIVLSEIRACVTYGEDSRGRIMHQGYMVPMEDPPGQHEFTAFAMKGDTNNAKKRHLIPLGCTYAQGYEEAVCVILSHPPTQNKITTYAVDAMTVRGTLDLLLKVELKIPAWAKANFRGR